MLAYLLSDKTPFYTLDELADELEHFGAYLQQHRDFLLATGLPPVTFKGSRWLYEELGRLYDTRCTFSPWPNDEFASEAIAQKTVPYEWARYEKRQIRQGERCRPSIADIMDIVGAVDHVECEYAEADFLDGMQAADAVRLEACRPAVYTLKLETLNQLVQATRDRRADETWRSVVTIITKHIPHGDLEFLLSMDRFYLGTDVRVERAGTEDPKMVPGGLSNLIDVVGHIEKEICIGTLYKTKNLCGTSLPNGAIAEQHGEHPASTHYFNAWRHGTHQQLDAILDEARRLGEQEAVFWQDYAERVRQALGPGYRVPVPVFVRLKDAPTMAEKLKAMADSTSQNPLDLRDKEIYDRLISKEQPAVIMREINKKWPDDTIESYNGLKAAAFRYADRYGLPRPPLRRPGRPK